MAIFKAVEKKTGENSWKPVAQERSLRLSLRLKSLVIIALDSEKDATLVISSPSVLN